MRFVTLCFLLAALLVNAQSITFAEYFSTTTLRVDYYHSGTATQEFFSLDQVYEEGEWPGSKTRLLDTLNYGSYLAQIYDAANNQLIYSYGFSSIFAEWQTTDDAIAEQMKTMHESVRLPMPLKPIKFTISKRNKKSMFEEKFSITIDPNSRFVNRELEKFPFAVKKILNNGAPEHKVDILIIGDGFAKSDTNKFLRAVKHYTDVLFDEEPFKSRKSDFNVWAIDAISQGSGVDEPRKNVWKRTLLDISFNTFDLPRYVLAPNNKNIRDVASLAPYDHIYILFNSPRYGGGGIYHCQATCYVGSEGADPGWWSDYVFVHEFGHSFAGLADEYYSSDVAYNEFYRPDVEPWEPNITNLVNFDAKWKDMMGDQPIPTEWKKAEYDSLSALAYKSSGEKREHVQKQAYDILHNSDMENVIGVYQGAGYSSEGMYRAAPDCRMFSKSLNQFCPVCQKAIIRKIDFETR